MKKVFLYSFIIFLTIAVGTAIVFFNKPRSLSKADYDEAISAGVPTVEYCDLKNNPSKYDGKVVRVNAKLNWFMHGYFLADENCSGKGDSARTAISFVEEKREEYFDYLQTFKEPKQLWKPVNIIAVGEFQYEKPSGFSDGIEDRTDLHFEVYKIEFASR